MRNRRKMLPVGVENFKEIAKGDFYYVDKTLMIRDLLGDGGKVNLFTRPRRFGKSLNMSMLKTFFEVGTNHMFFQGMNISREKDLCSAHMGKYPVISITLKGVDGRNFRAASAALKNVIGNEALRFQFLSGSPKLSAQEKELYRQLIQAGDGQDGIFAMSEGVMVEGLRTLSKLLAKHFESPVIILIDEYDVPLDKAFHGGYYNEMVTLIRNLLGNGLKTNESLYFAVLTGCLRISKESIFTGLNNLKTYTITDPLYGEYFGFTGDEVQNLLNFYGLADYWGIMQEWYDGYRFGNASLFCPWDVINFCSALLEDSSAFPENYWANTSGNAMVRRLIGLADRRTKGEVERLMAGEAVVKEINQNLTYNEIDSSMENLWSVLFATGYLTYRERISKREYRLAIPNKEIEELFADQVWKWFEESSRADGEKLQRFCEAFPRGDEERIEELLRDYLWNSISVRDTAARAEKKEHFYHGLLLGLLQYEGNWDTQSNEETGSGFCDLSIRTPQRIGVVIEIKYASDGKLEEACRKALEQIEKQHYEAALLQDGMEQIVKYGIAFYKKNCKVRKA